MIFIPRPQVISYHNGNFTLGLYTKLVLSTATDMLARTGARQLQSEIAQFAGFAVEILRGQARKGDILLDVLHTLPKQSYQLTITDALIIVLGGDESGLLNGIQTLRQIVRQSGCELPTLYIEDAPSFQNRGFYHDVTRGRIPTMDTLKQLADDACFYKLNQLQLYVEHTYLFRDLVEVWHGCTPLSAEEIMELDDYCAARGIELVPSLSCFGHLFELLHTKTYNDLCELPEASSMPSTMSARMHHHTLNISDARALPLITRMISEFIPLFRSRFFNICADETFDLGTGRGKAQMEAVGENNYYTGFVKKLCEFVVAQGCTPMFWGDIVVRFADSLKELPAGTICLNWGYSPTEGEDSTRILAEVGATQYVCPGVCGWNTWMNHLRDSYDNISRMAGYGKKYRAVGLLNTDWGDYGHVNDPMFSLPGMIYGAAFSWNDTITPFDELNADISRLTYLDASGQAVGLLARMQETTVYHWRAIIHHIEWKHGVYELGATSLSSVDTRLVPAANLLMDELLHDLHVCLTHMDSSRRSMLNAWSIAGEGIKLWNLVGAAIAENRKDAALADMLENWCFLYEQFWRKTCRESNLKRVGDVTHWYADELR